MIKVMNASSRKQWASVLSNLDDRWLIVFLLIIALSVRIAIVLVTRLAAEDAFITFRYAQQLAHGNGFVHNTGERVYGTTTPLFTVLMAIWHLISQNVLIGAWSLNVTSVAGGLVFLWFGLRQAEISRVSRLFVLGSLLAASKFWSLDVTGMETSMVIFLMSASLYALLKERMILTGIIAGLLLWTRIDTALWVLALLIITLQRDWRDSLRIGAVALCTYLPWMLFASLYFGSPIPHTIIAKLYAYPRFSLATLFQDIRTSLILVSPLAVPSGMELPPLLASMAIIIVAAWHLFKDRGSQLMRLLGIFAGMEAVRLLISHSMIFTRYFAPLLWAILILFGLGLGAIYTSYVSGNRGRQALFIGMVVAVLLYDLALGLGRVEELRYGQASRNEGSLKQIGLWLNQNSPVGSTVLLEPLGYIGYYADRRMLDVVGLVTPQVVEMKKRGLNDVYLYLADLQPDYVVAHCEEAESWLVRSGADFYDFGGTYSLVSIFNPLRFNPEETPGDDFEAGLSRSACYQIWQRDSSNK